jgi:hypothetical protein
MTLPAKASEPARSPWLEVGDYGSPDGWTGTVADASGRARSYCRQLEQGEILLFSRAPFDLPQDDREFLLAQRQTSSRFHKNISYRPTSDVLRGLAGDSPERARLQNIFRYYSAQVTRFISRFLAPYAGKFMLDFASFRPLEEAGRSLPLHKRNDLLHVDAFPTRPTRGGRILRVFTNINPSAPRVWQTGLRFHELAPRYADGAGLRRFALPSPLLRLGSAALALTGMGQRRRSPYDRFMLRFHDYLKENSDFQQNSPKATVDFPPHCTWLVYTDGVPHAVLSGQYALEQTYIVPPEALVAPEVAPIRVLEQLAGKPLAS